MTSGPCAWPLASTSSGLPTCAPATTGAPCPRPSRAASSWFSGASSSPIPPGLEDALFACERAGVPLIINDDPTLAVDVGADGAHVGQEDLPAAEARVVLGPDRALGVSTHDLTQIRAAEADGADHLGFGPCFPTTTKGYTEGQPREAVRAAAAATRLPLFAIGGITADNLPELLEVGVRRVAVSSAILAAPDPERAARRLRDLLDTV